MAVFKNRDTGMIKVLVREDGDRVYLGDLGNEANSYAMPREEFEDQFEELNFEDFKPVTSGHSAGAARGAAYAEAAEDDLEEAADQEPEEEETEEEPAPPTNPVEASEALGGDPDIAAPGNEGVTLTGDAGSSTEEPDASEANSENSFA